MATEILMPRQGNTVESCIILEWKKQEGDAVEIGEAVCEVETDKATFEVESESAGTVLKHLYEEGDDVPVLKPIAIVGEDGEDISAMLEEAGGTDGSENAPPAAAPPEAGTPPPQSQARKAEASQADTGAGASAPGISPRARTLASSQGVDPSSIRGSGPGGRIIERDVQAVLGGRQPMTPAAIEAHLKEGTRVPAQGTGIGGRITARDLGTAARSTDAVDSVTDKAGATAGAVREAPPFGETREIPVKGIRKIIAERMAASLTGTAQLTMHSSADARQILAYRKRLKSAPEETGLSAVTINDLLLFAVVKTLPRFPFMNAHFMGDKIVEHGSVNLGFAVDTERGLMVPVVKNAHALSLKNLALETKRLAKGCLEGGIGPDELQGGTFTVTNLGALGIESFTPVLNTPEVGILGVCSIEPKPVLEGSDGEAEFVPHIGLSLTINHQAVDGAPGARFLKALCEAVGNYDLLLAE
jgi:pyruvate dehydrogenase E2 component (dihydrolipoamide acetyltransferase)